MRWNSRRDGAVAVFDEDPNSNDLIIIEPIVQMITPTRAGRCSCGGELDLRCATDGVSEVFCFRCHTTLARINLGTRVHR